MTVSDNGDDFDTEPEFHLPSGVFFLDLGVLSSCGHLCHCVLMFIK